MKTKLPGYYTVDEAAKVLKRSPQMIRRYIQQGDLPAIVIGQQHLIEQTHVHDFSPRPRGNPKFSECRKRNAG